MLRSPFNFSWDGSLRMTQALALPCIGLPGLLWIVSSTSVRVVTRMSAVSYFSAQPCATFCSPEERICHSEPIVAAPAATLREESAFAQEKFPLIVTTKLLIPNHRICHS